MPTSSTTPLKRISRSSRSASSVWRRSWRELQGPRSVRITMTRFHLAQFNIARIRYPLDDPRMAEFVDNVHRINGLAEQIEGFIWRLQDESGHAMNMIVY